jgi:hypothetical protein
MKFGMQAFATVLVAGFFVLEAPAQEAIKAPSTVVTTSDYRTVQPARNGLFSRLRNRNNVTSVSATTVAPPMATPTTKVEPTTPPVVATPTTVTPTTQIVEPRQGLFARLRARSGR